jgi:hypothetical protein
MLPSSVAHRRQPPAACQPVLHPPHLTSLHACTSALFACERRTNPPVSRELRTLSQNTRGYTPESEDPAKPVPACNGSQPVAPGTPNPLESKLTPENPWNVLCSIKYLTASLPVASLPPMATASPLRSPKREPIPIDARAADHLRYIRETMQSAGEFTAVPGWGGVAMGLTAIAAAFAASRQSTPRGWVTVWLVEAFVAIAIAAPAAATKAHRANAALFSGPGRRFLLSFAPPILVGGLLTIALFRAGAFAALPGVWLLLYGTAIVTGGAFSVRVVPLMGLCLMAFGAVALFVPPGWGDVLMAAGFGALQIGFGIWIARHHGG